MLKNNQIDAHQVTKFVNQFWGNAVMPAFSEFIRIPSKSPLFDQKWEEHGHLEAAAHLLAEWALAQNIPGLKAEVIKMSGRTPLLYVEIPGASPHTTLLYGHLDKMPEAEGWDKDLGPWKPIVKNNRFYGRGTADDGYAFFSLITAIKFLQKENLPYNRCVVLFEAGEESDSRDLPIYLQKLRRRIGQVTLVLCLDCVAHDYDNLWCTTSLRGVIEGTLQVSLLKIPVHSGAGSGIIASTFRIIRHLLERIENAATGKVLLQSCYTTIPQEHKIQAHNIAKILGRKIYTEFPLLGNTVRPVTTKHHELLLNRSWRPTISIIGAAGLPQIADAGSVLRPTTALQLSVRIPPLCAPAKIAQELQKTLEHHPPYGAKVKFKVAVAVAGWATPKTQPWLTHALDEAATIYFGRPALHIGDGGSIGVIPILQQAFPKAQFVLTGACGPQSNEHGPNESLYLPMAKKITGCVAYLLAKQCAHSKK